MYSDRNDILKSSSFLAQISIAVCDWVNYWAINGTSIIQDQTQREQTDAFISVFLIKPDLFIQKIAYLAISEAPVKNAVEVTDQNVSDAVNTILSNAIAYLL